VSLAEDEHVIQTLAPDRTDEPLREGVLPRAVRGRENLLDPHAVHLPKCLTIDSVTLKWTTRRRWWARTTRTNRTRRRAVGTVKKSIKTTSGTWLARNAR
jgi:hypothetical protein